LLTKCGSIRQAREIRQMLDLASCRALANDKRLDFAPLAAAQGNHRAVSTQHQTVRSTWLSPAMLEDVLGLRRLEGDIGCSGGLGLPAHRRFAEVNPSTAFELLGGPSERHPGS